MPRGYQTKSSRSPFLSGIKFLFIIILAFVAGYWCSIWWDRSGLIEWINAGKQALSQTHVSKLSKPIHNSTKPKLEFYTLLTKDQDDIINPASNTPTVIANVPAGILRANPDAKPTATIPNKEIAVETKSLSVAAAKPTAKGSYLIQLAAFRARQDAEHMKANLVLKGFDVRITAISQAPGKNWYRVMIGPYSSKERASQALSNLAKTEHVTGMIRFVNV